MKYDDIELDMQWFPHILSLTLIKYFPRIYTASPTKLVLDFKENQPLALRKVRNLALEALRDYEELEEFRRGYLVALPSHDPNKVNAPCEYLCAELARAFPHQLVYLGQVLKRVIKVEKSATAPSGKRPTYADHISSIAYAGPQINSRERIIMVDDVLTLEATSSACRDILKQATGCKDVQGFFVAKTTYQ